MKSLLGKLENDTQSDETEREEDVFTWLNGRGGGLTADIRNMSGTEVWI